ncbi:beta-ketoacyl-[acyl-carrier-protein] synthase family protein [Nocardia terpenica]|uniref:3-oxoacyl-[acyl-carrier-protein] synthase 1 n=1 Tax=Nocardia terpenica TaxID=455432 RepID=A0A164I3H6_9NOCA|nr:beta-ketoacyl-[acyl-carrier-protein] synthase family protein [Nocardia terpenica]KZM69067.1 3-oxoacyl-ACP synthase [Nocardia terpenica]NQE87831.1 beta-ketoacyl-[acyl-carrier-protein] synthase family protein [Nocardia terpenica]
MPDVGDLPRVVVTGLGAISAFGPGAAPLLAGIREGRSGIGRAEQFDVTGFDHELAGEVRDFAPERHLRRLAPRDWGRTALFAATAARLAATDAGFDTDTLPFARAVSCFGTTNGESQLMERIAGAMAELGADAVRPELAGRADGGSVATAAAAELGIEGQALTVGTACAAANYAIGYAYDLIRGGQADVAVCGGADASNRAIHAGFHRLGALAKDVPRPFDTHRDGIVTAEGGVALLLERLDSARARGARIYAEVLGYGMRCDARHMTNPDTDSIAECIRIAQRHAGVRPAEVDYISAHGTGTRANDIAEVSAVRSVFGDHVPPISSIKSMLGHTMGAAAGFGALVCCAAIRDGFLPPTATLTDPDPELGPGLDHVPGRARAARVRVAQNHGFAFGGNNAITIFGAVPA